jgi:hypothetical protein
VITDQLFKSTLLHEWSGAFSIDSPTPTLRMNLNLNGPTILFACVILLFWLLLTSLFYSKMPIPKVSEQEKCSPCHTVINANGATTKY